MLDQLYIAGNHETERGPFTVICSHGVDGNICDVYGVTAEHAEMTATEIVERITRTFAEDAAKEKEKTEARRPRLKLLYSTIEKPKADFLKHSITFQVSIPLTDETLQLRDKFERLASERKAVTVEIVSAQLALFDMTPAPDSPNNITDDESETTEPVVDASGEMVLAHDEAPSDEFLDQLADEIEKALEREGETIVNPASSMELDVMVAETIGASDVEEFAAAESLNRKQKKSKAAKRIENENRAARARQSKKSKRAHK